MESSLKLVEPLLMGPGPMNMPDFVKKSMLNPLLHYRQEELFQVMDRIKELIRSTFKTKNRYSIALSTTGHGAMEMCISNLAYPGESVLVLHDGFWGDRAGGMITRCGASPIYVRKELGTQFKLSQVEEAIVINKPSVVYCVQGESSTGLLQDISFIGPLCRKYNALLIVDAVVSFGAAELYMDEWQIDACFTAVQKVLCCSPGMSLVSLGIRAENKMLNRDKPNLSYILDGRLIGRAWRVYDPYIYHHTYPMTMIYAIHDALLALEMEGLENSWKKHTDNVSYLWEGLQKFGLILFILEPKWRLPSLTSVSLPSSLDWHWLLKMLKERYNIIIAGGLGHTDGKIIRIGAMGFNSDKNKIDILLHAIKELLQETKYKSNL